MNRPNLMNPLVTYFIILRHPLKSPTFVFFQFRMICAALDWDDEPNMDIAWNVHMASLHQTYCRAYVMKVLKEQKCAYISYSGTRMFHILCIRNPQNSTNWTKWRVPRNMWLWRFVFLQNRRQASSDRQFVDDVGAGSISWFVHFTWSNTTLTSAW